MAQLTRLVAPLLALLLAGSAGVAADAPKALVGRVVSIVDGDTIKVRIGDRTETVRYIGMNTPELHHPTKGVEPLAREATEANRKLVESQTVRLNGRYQMKAIKRGRYFIVARHELALSGPLMWIVSCDLTAGGARTVDLSNRNLAVASR